MMKANTIRGIDPEMAERLKNFASRQRKSINQVILEMLRQELGIEKRKRYTRTYDDLDELFGRWSDSEFEQIQGSIDKERKIDPELWL